MRKICITLTCLLVVCVTYADNGYRLWLRYDGIEDGQILLRYRTWFTGIQINDESLALHVAKEELVKGLEGLPDKKIPEKKSVYEGTIICATSILAPIESFFSLKEISDPGLEGFIILSRYEKPDHTLQYYESLQLPFAPEMDKRVSKYFLIEIINNGNK